MATDARAELRRIVSLSIEAFIGAVERRHGKAALGVGDLRAAAGLTLSPVLATLIDANFSRLAEAMDEERLRRQRGDPLQRLLVHPFAPALRDGRLSRELLPNFFSFIHLVMGDRMAVLAARCQDIRAELAPDSDWGVFYDDPRAEQVLWAVLLRIAETFRRFEARRDWFIGLMQYSPQAVSLSANAFVPTAPGTDKTPPPVFGKAEFNILFAGLFGPLRRLSDAQAVRFERDFGAAAADALLAPLWANLEASGASL